MGEIETRGPDAEAFLQRILSNDVSKIAEDGAQYSVLCKDDGGVLDDLFTLPARARPLPDRHQRVATTRRTSRGSSEHAADVRRHGRGPPARLRDARGPGAGGARRSSTKLADGELPEALPHRDARPSPGRRTSSSPAPATPARTASSCCSRREHATAVWDALTASGRDARSASAPATPCGSRSASTSTATTCPRTAARSRPASAGAARRTRASSARTPIAAPAPDGTAERLVPFVLTGPGIARQGNPVVGGGEVTSGTLSPVPELRHRDGVRARRARPSPARVRDRRSRQAADRRGPREAPLPQGG